MGTQYSRRRFLKSTLIAGTAIAGSQFSADSEAMAPENKKRNKYNYDAKGLPTVILGKTGVTIPKIAIGLGSRFCTIEKTDYAIELLNFALNNGLYYWDTAHSYENTATKVVSEERIGLVVKERRKEIFLSTKVTAREPDKAKWEIEASLRRLQTDHLDMLKIHGVETMQEVEAICRKGGILDIISNYKDQKITRFIGFSGHGDVNVLKTLVETDRFDSMLCALNQWGGGKNDRQGILFPEAKKRGMGLMVIKVIRPKDTIKEINPVDLVRYALSIEGPDGIVLGIDSKAVIESNLNILRNFKPMSKEEKLKTALLLEPFFYSKDLPWLKDGYSDGSWS